MVFGSLGIPAGAGFAPMAGLSDRSARSLMSRFGAAYTVSEMASASAICHGDRKTLRLLQRGGSAPFGMQLFGSDPGVLARAAAAVMELGPDFIDLNMGCPAPKITKTGAGSALLKDPALCGRIVRAVREAVPVPVTVKMRTGWDADSITCAEAAKACEAEGAAAVAVHGRTCSQQYAPPVDLRSIAAVCRAVRIPVVANGDILSAAGALDVLQETGCAAVLIGRGALGNPWIFGEVRAALSGERLPARPRLAERMQVMCSQIAEMCGDKGEGTAMREARPQAMYYMKGLNGAPKLRYAACAMQRYTDAEDLAEMALRLNPGA